MNWSYIAGIFDGEGCVCVTNRKNPDLRIIICTTSQSLADSLIEFLGKENVVANYYRKKNHLGTSGYVTITGRTSVEKFTKSIFSEVVIKVEILKIVLDVLENNDFEGARIRLHKLSMKGPKTLTPWKGERVLPWSISRWSPNRVIDHKG